MFYYAHINVTEKHVFRGSVHLNSILDNLKEFKHLNSAMSLNNFSLEALNEFDTVLQISNIF